MVRRGDGRGWWEGIVGRGGAKGWWKGVVGYGDGLSIDTGRS